MIAEALIAALSAGAVAGATDTAKQALADAYNGLKSLIKHTFGHDSEAAAALDKLEANPESKGRKQTLDEELQAADADAHPQLVASAQSLLEALRSLPPSEHHSQVAHGTNIAQADHGSSARVYSGVLPPKGS